MYLQETWTILGLYNRGKTFWFLASIEERKHDKIIIATVWFNRWLIMPQYYPVLAS